MTGPTSRRPSGDQLLTAREPDGKRTSAIRSADATSIGQSGSETTVYPSKVEISTRSPPGSNSTLVVPSFAPLASNVSALPSVWIE